MRKLISVTTLLALLFTFMLPAYAGNINDLRHKETQAKKHIEQTKKELNKKNKEEATLTDQLNNLTSTVLKLEDQLQRLNKRLLNAQQRVDAAQKELDEINKKLDKQLSIFKKRLINIYQNQDVKLIEVFTGSTSFTDFLVRVEMFKQIVDHDLNMLEDIKEMREKQKKLKKELEEKRDEVAVLKKETEHKKKEFEKKQNEHKKLLQKVQQEKAYIEKALREEEETHRKIVSMIKRLEEEQRRKAAQAAKKSSPNTSTPSRGTGSTSSVRETGSGVLGWPVPGHGRVTSDYGWRKHPILGTNRFHDGIDIGAPHGVSVVASAAGTVIYAGFYGAYGNTVTIMHDNGLTTMYCHLSSISVRNGQSVKRGQTIGKIGSTGLSTGPHLHYTVLKNGESVNPWSYLR